MTTFAPSITRVRISVAALPAAYWLLRIGAALCFIGHGAFGFITKAAWLPYFAVAGIPEPWAWRLMPLIGAADILAGMAVLFAPRATPIMYMIAWAAWTALLRPLAGEPVWETLERAGNYGVPLALLVLTGVPRTWRELWLRRESPITSLPSLERVAVILKWTTATLLAGHGAIAALTASPVLGRHLEAIGLPMSASSVIGWLEIVLAVAIIARPAVGLLVLAGAWKLATESLWIAAGAPVWEFVERAGSYVAPLALAVLTLHLAARPSTPVQARRTS